MWSYETPTEVGMYYVNLGDVVTPANLSVETFTINSHRDCLVDSTGFAVGSYNPSCKFLKIDIDELNQMGNKE